MSSRDARRARILDAARAVMLRHGYRKATLEDVAAEAGVSRATVYNHFGNKEAVFRELVAVETARIEAAVRAALDPAAPPEARLRALVAARYARLRELRALYAVALDGARAALPAALDVIADFQRRQVALVAGLLAEGVAAGRFRRVEPERLAAALLAALRGMDESFVFENRDEAAAGAEALMDVVVAGLLAREEAP